MSIVFPYISELSRRSFLTAEKFIQLAPKTYVIYERCDLPSDITIVGIPKRTTILLADNFGDSIAWCFLQNNQQNITVKNITFDLNGFTDITALRINRATDLELDHVVATSARGGMFGAAIELQEVKRATLTQCGGISMSGHCIALKNSQAVNLLNCFSEYAYHRAVLIDPDCEDINVMGGHFWHSRYTAIHISHGSRRVTVAGTNIGYGEESGIAVQADGPNEAGYEVIIKDNTIHHTGKNAIVGSGSENVIVKDNLLLESKQNALRLVECTGWNVHDNTGSSSIFRGAALENSSRNTIKDNRFDGNASQPIGLFGDCKYNTITDNTFYNNTGTTLYQETPHVSNTIERNTWQS